MRELRFVLDLSDGTRRDQAILSFAQAETTVRKMIAEGKERGHDAHPAPDMPFALFLDEEESFFMMMPETEGLQVTIRVLDKWNLFGILAKDRAFTLDFGILSLEDSLTLLRLFYDNNYPALRSLEKCMKN